MKLYKEIGFNLNQHYAMMLEPNLYTFLTTNPTSYYSLSGKFDLFENIFISDINLMGKVKTQYMFSLPHFIPPGCGFFRNPVPIENYHGFSDIMEFSCQIKGYGAKHIPYMPSIREPERLSLLRECSAEVDSMLTKFGIKR